jgi:hypothetical protein
MSRVLFVAILLVAQNASLEAQQSTALTIGVHRSADVRPSNQDPDTVDVENKRPPTWPFITLGAFIGGVAAAVWVSPAINEAEFLPPPVALVIPVVGGAALGALFGWITYRIVH